LHRVFVVDAKLRERVRAEVAQIEGSDLVDQLTARARGNTYLITFPRGEQAPREADLQTIQQALANDEKTAMLALTARDRQDLQVAEADHRVICEALEIAPAEESLSVGVPDFGSGALGASVILVSEFADRVHKMYVVLNDVTGIIDDIEGGDPVDLLDSDAGPAILVRFPHGEAEPRPGELDQVTFSPGASPPRAHFALVSSGGSEEQAAADHAKICERLGIEPRASVRVLPIQDFGNGALAATIILVEIG
jgi:hypothetical protein